MQIGRFFKRCLTVSLFVLGIIAYLSVFLYAGDFDVDRIIEGLNIDDPAVQEDLILLQDYFQCRAALNDDPGECDKLGRKGKICTKHYNRLHGFFRELILIERTTVRALRLCISKYRDRTSCRILSEAFTKNDASFCKKLKSRSARRECEAIATLNSGLRPEWSDEITYIKALKEFDERYCGQIKDESLNRECRAYITGKEEICEECEGFIKFRDKYSR
ncbi:MAG: hypothetical protein JRI96_06300 [Deltaproteobacteria bacterium]|nr:hypothetical protein [Deltaproteobacteria bacterium]